MIVYRFGPFRLEREPLLLRAGEAPLPLGPKVVETLLALVEHPGQVLDKHELIARVWPEGYVEEANLAQNIYVIRKTLRTYWPCCAIETLPRRGYRFVGEVVSESPAAPVPTSRRGMPRHLFAIAALAAVLALAAGIGSIEVARSGPAGAVARLSQPGARLYAMGMYYWNRRTPASIQMSIRYFEKVQRTDPSAPSGYAGLASAYAIEGDYGFGPLRRAVSFQRASAFAHRALAIDPNSAQALAALGLTQDDTNHPAQAKMEYDRAIADDPRYAPAHQWYGALLLRAGEGARAYAQLQEAADLDPASVAATDWLSQAAYLMRHYREALSYARQTIDLSPHRYDAYGTMGMAYEALGEYDAAIHAYKTFAQSCPDCRARAAPLLAHVYAATHDYTDALAQLRLAKRGLARRDVDPEDIVTALIALGQRREALQMLRDPKQFEFPAVLAIDPRMDPVRGDPRFRRYMQHPG